MNDETLQVMAVIAKVQTLVDGGVKATVDTSELTPEQMMKLFSLKGKAGWMVFKENQITIEDVPEADADLDPNEKSPCKRLKDRMFVYFRDVLNRPKHDFEAWYRRELEKIGEKYLEKLN